ncbi:MAG: phosphodiester glycosidase family protein [Candidatus Muiribacteriota bacterium]
MIEKLLFFLKRIKFFKESPVFEFDLIQTDTFEKSNLSCDVVEPDKYKNFKFLNKKSVIDFEKDLKNHLTDNNFDIDFKVMPVSLLKSVKFTKKIFTFLIIFFYIGFSYGLSKDGITYSKIDFLSANGPQIFHITKIDKNSGYRLRVVLADFKLISRETVSNISKKYNAKGAINAAYFAWTGQILGTVIMNHRIISLPIYRRAVFCINSDDSMFITVPDIKPYVEFNGEKIPVEGINQKSFQNKTIVYTPEYGKNTLTDEHGIELTVINDTIVEIGSRNAVIPPNGFVIAVRDNEILNIFEKARLFDPLKFKISMDPVMENVKYAIGGGPNLLTDGEIDITHIEENFKPNLVNQRAPRTVVGFDFEDNIFLVTLDGRQKDYSIGMTLKELAEWLKDYGLKNAMNLDGGGSSTLVLDGKVINRPSDGRERKINGAIIIERK